MKIYPAGSEPKLFAGISCNVSIEVRDAASGELLEEVRVHNDPVDDGLEHLIDLFLGTGSRPDAVKFGTGSSATGDTMADLEVPVFTAIVARRVPDKPAQKFTIESFLGTGDANGNTLSEEGVFAGGVMLVRALLSPAIVKTNLVTATIKHDFLFSKV